MDIKTLICIVGPTAVGKSALALALAHHWQAEIVSVDARQVYRGMDIGTAKVTAAEQAQARHHLIDHLAPDARYDAARFAAEAEAILSQCFAHNPVAIMVGGATLYYQAFWYGFDPMPSVPTAIRDQLEAEWHKNGLGPLVEELEQADPDTFAVIDRQNPARVIRALEVYRASGQPISAFRKGRKPLHKPYRTLILGLQEARSLLYPRIDARVEEMIEAGLEAEVRGLVQAGYTAEHQGMRSIGYQEWFPYFEGKYDLAEVKRLIQRNSRRYAKRQLTFFRRFKEINWFSATEQAAIQAWLDEQMPAES